MHGQKDIKNSASSGYPPELYKDARSEKYKKFCVKFATHQNYTKMHGQKDITNSASSWLPTRIIQKCTIRKI
jgi:hypothetical protein